MATESGEWDDLGTGGLPGRSVLEMQTLRQLSRRSDVRGTLHAAGHFALMGATAALVAWAGNGWLLVPAMVLHGFTIVTMFAPMHECVHKTAFRTRLLNDLLGWIAGGLCFYNATFYRRYHTWHHRYTQDLERDPELESPKPQTLPEYLWHLSGIPFWLAKPRELMGLALGCAGRRPYIPSAAVWGVTVSAAAQLGLYLVLAAVSLAFRSDAILRYWLIPAMLAQPLLRAILIVEHTGCTQDDNGLTNTRTTLAFWPVRFLMWNMPYHAEHHLYPSIPFFRLPNAHRSIRERLVHIAPSYPAANYEVVRGLGPRSDTPVEVP